MIDHATRRGPFETREAAGRQRFHSSFGIVRLLLVLTSITCVSCTASAQTKEAEAMPRNQLMAMLEAINKIRTPRDIGLNCLEYVYPHLGRSEVLNPYLQLFAANGVNPSVARQGNDRYIGFEIKYSLLKQVPNSRFGALDVVVVEFVTDGETPNSSIRSCKAVLKAAPHHL